MPSCRPQLTDILDAGWPKVTSKSVTFSSEIQSCYSIEVDDALARNLKSKPSMALVEKLSSKVFQKAIVSKIAEKSFFEIALPSRREACFGDVMDLGFQKGGSNKLFRKKVFDVFLKGGV